MRNFSVREQQSSRPATHKITQSQIVAEVGTAANPSIVADCRYHARDATRVLATLGLSPAWLKRS